MKLWKCLAVSKMIAATSVAETCWDLPVYPGLGLAASSCTDNGLTADTGTCSTTCNSGTIDHTCSCRDGSGNLVACSWSNTANNCMSVYHVKVFEVVWSVSTPTDAAVFETTASASLINIFTAWIAQKEAANVDKVLIEIDDFDIAASGIGRRKRETVRQRRSTSTVTAKVTVRYDEQQSSFTYSAADYTGLPAFIEGEDSTITATAGTVTTTLSIVEAEFTDSPDNPAPNMADAKTVVLATLAQLDADINAVKADIVDIEAEISQLEAEEDDLEADIATLDGEITTLNADITQLDLDIAAQGTLLADKTTELSNEQDNKVTAESNKATADQAKIDKETEVSDKQGEITAEETTITTKEGEITTATGTIIDKAGELSLLKDESAAITAEIDDIEAKIATTADNQATIDDEIATLEADIQKLQDDKATQDDANTDANTTNTEKETEIGEQDAVMAELQAEIDSLNKKMKLVAFTG